MNTNQISSKCISIICLTNYSVITGKRIYTVLKNLKTSVSIHGLRSRVKKDDVHILFDNTIAHLQKTFLSHSIILGVCASGIIIRAIAPFLRGKWNDQAIIAVDQLGETFIPLLGGHHGANEICRILAKKFKGNAAITTASETFLGISLDEPPNRWKISTKTNTIKNVTSKLITNYMKDKESTHDTIVIKSDFENCLLMKKNRVCNDSNVDDQIKITYHRPVLVLGVGCAFGCNKTELISLVINTFKKYKISINNIACVVSIDLKMNEYAVHELARYLDVPVRFFSAKKLEHEFDRLKNPSEIVFNETGCHGVCEGAALAAVGKSGELIIAKHKSIHATCAVGYTKNDINPLSIGVPRGQLSIVGIGPGDIAWCTPEAQTLILNASDIVGYKMYLKLIESLCQEKICHSFHIGDEEKRTRHALNLAAKGKTVVLIGSGDPGIYALATLVFELLDSENRSDWNRIKIEVSPGISAMQAVAARIGAPLGHDFCAISLSDLLTPKEDILYRLHAASKSDFVIALYNPSSKKRQDLLIEAKNIFLQYRTPDTPVILGYQVGRVNEKITVITLSKLDIKMVDALTTVLIGSSKTRYIKRGLKEWIYTPRGYSKKNILY